MTRQNLALFEKTMRMFSPFGAAMGREGESQSAPRAPAGNGAAETKAASADDVSELKSEIETMRRQLTELAKGRGG
jgi:polyhydroxyalkanoate synthesis regulator protein